MKIASRALFADGCEVIFLARISRVKKLHH